MFLSSRNVFRWALAGSLSAVLGCTTTPVPVPVRPTLDPPPAHPALEPPAARIPPAPDEPAFVLEPCLDGAGTQEALSRAAQRAFGRHDARCWAAADTALAFLMLDESGRTPEELRDTAYRFRQAQLRASRHGHDDIAAVAHLGRARIAMAAGDAERTLVHLERAVDAASLHAAATGEAPPALDAILLLQIIETLAQWERTGDARHFDAAAAASARLKGREALRGWQRAGHGPRALARAGALREGREQLEELALRTKDLASAWGALARERAPRRATTAEAVVRSGPAWMAQAPLLLEWMPGEVRQVAAGAAAVMADGEVLLDYTVGTEHGALLVIWSTGVEAHPLPGRANLEAMVERCRAGQCEPLFEALLAPASGRLATARQVLVAAHDVLHRAPFESLLTVRTYRIPSVLTLTGLRLRAWERGPNAHPEARALLQTATTDDPERGLALVAPDGVEALPGLRAVLASGPTEVRWEMPGQTRLFGAPLTLPARPDPDAEGDASDDLLPAPDEDPAVPVKAEAGASPN